MALKLIIRDKDTLLYDKECETVTSLNEVGEFDVLATHANFITLVSKYIVINKHLKDEKTIPIKRGVLSVTGDNVEVYVQE